MKIKVCGMREKDNVTALEKTGADYIGFIFYEGSSRFVNPEIPVVTTSLLPVGVFVNAGKDFIKKMIESWDLEYIQLHGGESAEFCQEIREMGVKVIKAFSVDEDFDFSETENYSSSVDYFLFDTKGKNYGGNGIPFDWKILDRYQGNQPFWLSGGIHPGMADQIKDFYHPMLYAIDINSGFEDRPGLKNIKKIENFLHEIRS